jgi:hypothetical protein
LRLAESVCRQFDIETYEGSRQPCRSPH